MNKFEDNNSNNEEEIAAVEKPQLEENNNEQEKQAELLYYFTTDPELVKQNGFRGSENIDKGISGRGQSLYGTYFFNNLDDVENYRPLMENLENKSGKKGVIIQAELDPTARVLDGSQDENAAYLKEYNEFKKTTDLETGTPEFQKAFTDFLKIKGYDVIKIMSSLLGNHTEVIVINEDKLKYKGNI